jgi:hypothetical protein
MTNSNPSTSVVQYVQNFFRQFKSGMLYIFFSTRIDVIYNLISKTANTIVAQAQIKSAPTATFSRVKHAISPFGQATHADAALFYKLNKTSINNNSAAAVYFLYSFPALLGVLFTIIRIAYRITGSNIYRLYESGTPVSTFITGTILFLSVNLHVYIYNGLRAADEGGGFSRNTVYSKVGDTIKYTIFLAGRIFGPGTTGFIFELNAYATFRGVLTSLLLMVKKYKSEDIIGPITFDYNFFFQRGFRDVLTGTSFDHIRIILGEALTGALAHTPRDKLILKNVNMIAYSMDSFWYKLSNLLANRKISGGEKGRKEIKNEFKSGAPYLGVLLLSYLIPPFYSLYAKGRLLSVFTWGARWPLFVILPVLSLGISFVNKEQVSNLHMNKPFFRIMKTIMLGTILYGPAVFKLLPPSIAMFLVMLFPRAQYFGLFLQPTTAVPTEKLEATIANYSLVQDFYNSPAESISREKKEIVIEEARIVDNITTKN